MIDTFVNAVFLYDDKLVLTYNFREGTETITFDDLRNKLGEGFSGSDMSSVAAPKPPKNPRFRAKKLLTALRSGLGGFSILGVSGAGAPAHFFKEPLADF